MPSSYKFEDVLNKDGELIFTNVGYSMYPLIKEREDVLNHFYKECPNDDQEVIKKGVSEFINKLVEINAIIL